MGKNCRFIKRFFKQTDFWCEHISKYFYGIFLIAVFITGIFPYCMADTVTIYPTDDTYALSNLANSTSGTSAMMSIAYGPTAEHIGFIKFNTADLPPGVISSAYLYLDAVMVTAALNLNFQACNTSWAEGTLKYNNMPGVAGGLISYNLNGATGYFSVNITGIVEVWRSWNNYGLQIRETDLNNQILINAKESSDTPYLVINYNPLISPTITRTVNLSETPTNTTTQTETKTVTETRTITATKTETVFISATNTAVITDTVTPDVTFTKTPSFSYTQTNTDTATPGQTLSSTQTCTFTQTLTVTVTDAGTGTATTVIMVLITPTQTLTLTMSITPVIIETQTVTASPTQTGTILAAFTQTVTQTPVVTPVKTLVNGSFTIEDLRLFPNPMNIETANTFNCTFTVNYPLTSASLFIYTKAFRKVFKADLPCDNTSGVKNVSIPCQDFVNLASGLYYVYIESFNDRNEKARSRIDCLVIYK